MKVLLYLLCSACFWGCSSNQITTSEITAPDLLVQTPLPLVPGSISCQPLRINLRLFIDKNGEVKKVQYITGSGDKSWDEAALNSIMDWKYVPAKTSSGPVAIWVNQSIVIDYQEPRYVFLAELLCPSIELANRLYDSLCNGVDFSYLAEHNSIAITRMNKGFLGKVDVNLYPAYIRSEILKLGPNKFSRPIRFGDNYIIFKQMNFNNEIPVRKNNSGVVPALL